MKNVLLWMGFAVVLVGGAVGWMRWTERRDQEVEWCVERERANFAYSGVPEFLFWERVRYCLQRDHGWGESAATRAAKRRVQIT